MPDKCLDFRARNVLQNGGEPGVYAKAAGQLIAAACSLHTRRDSEHLPNLPSRQRTSHVQQQHKLFCPQACAQYGKCPTRLRPHIWPMAARFLLLQDADSQKPRCRLSVRMGQKQPLGVTGQSCASGTLRRSKNLIQQRELSRIE